MRRFRIYQPAYASDAVRVQRVGHQNDRCYIKVSYCLVRVAMMIKRSSTIVLLLIAFLFGAWSNVIAAAFCPRYLNRCCFKQTAHQPQHVDRHLSCHHDMPRMKMDDALMEAEAGSDLKADADATAEASPIELSSDLSDREVAFDLPVEACTHCLSRSQSTPRAVASVAVDPSKRLVETNAYPANFRVALPSGFAVSITPSEHGPPGNSFPRHILIGVFRI